MRLFCTGGKPLKSWKQCLFSTSKLQYWLLKCDIFIAFIKNPNVILSNHTHLTKACVGAATDMVANISMCALYVELNFVEILILI